jgi:hypothetical protein
VSCEIVALKTNWAAVMHWHDANRKDSEALRRLAVVLLTLASIAEGLALRTGAFRGIVLWLLCRAEARVRDLAFEIGGGAVVANPSTASPARWLGGAGEAARLAERFRALAAVFFALARKAALGVLPARRNGCVSRSANFHAVMRPGPCSGARHRLCIDTS